MTQEIPAAIRDMNTELVKLGLVDRIRSILASPEVTHITDLICWIEIKTEGQGGQTTLIKVVYKYTPKSLLSKSKRQPQPQRGRATFRVKEGHSFGPVTAEPLEDDLVLAVCDLAERFCV